VLSDEITLPCAQALLAGTLALMSAYAAPLAGSVGATTAECRAQMARKVVENLFFLREHPGLAPAMRAVVTKLHVHWSALVDPAPASPTVVPAAPVRARAAARLH
jgi:hypothetical protein